MQWIKHFLTGLYLFFTSFSVIGEVLTALIARRKLWLLPAVIFLLFFGVLLIVAQASPVSVIIYGLL